MSEASRKPKRPIAEVRAELLASAETQELAKTLGIGLEEYVEKVLAYYEDPSKEPQIYLAPEGQLRAAGYNPPSEKEIVEYLGKVASGEIDLRPDHLKDGFKGAEKPKVAGIGATDSGVHEAPQAGGDALRDQVAKQVKKDQNTKG